MDTKSKWGNIRALNEDIDEWLKFLEKHSLGSLPSFAKKAILKAIELEKKRLKKSG